MHTVYAADPETGAYRAWGQATTQLEASRECRRQVVEYCTHPNSGWFRGWTPQQFKYFLTRRPNRKEQ